MQPVNQNAPSGDSPRANGHSQLHELFALTDEQILEIDPAPQDVEVAGAAPAALLEGLDNAGTDSERGTGSSQQPAQSAQAQTAQAGVPALHAPPAWLADTMSDPQRGAEARAFAGRVGDRGNLQMGEVPLQFVVVHVRPPFPSSFLRAPLARKILHDRVASAQLMTSAASR